MFGGVFVHTCISCYLPKLRANSQHLSLGYLLLAGFLCSGEANRFPVPPALLCHAQHHAGTGTALFCLGHRAYGQGETSAPGWSSSSKRDWHSWEDADQARTTRGGWRGCIVSQRGEETLGREALKWEPGLHSQSPAETTLSLPISVLGKVPWSWDALSTQRSLEFKKEVTVLEIL